MIDIAAELFAETDLTLAVTIPLYWNDEDTWNDGDPLPGTTTVRGIFENPYLGLELGEAGQESRDPLLKLLTADIPYAREGDEITIAGSTYYVGTPQPNGLGVTEIKLTEA
jgi:hypothetical protein